MLITLNRCSQKLYHAQLKTLYTGTVPVVHPPELANWLNTNDSVFLLDIRSAKEYQVSQIAGACFMDYKKFSLANLPVMPQNAKVVVYCTVGVRSERVGEQIKAAGYKKVYNLYGGIINWKNMGYPVVDTIGNQSDKVHTYNRYWGTWLLKGIKVYD